MVSNHLNFSIITLTFTILFIFCSLFSTTYSISTPNPISLNQLNTVIKRAQKNIWDKQLPEKYWWYPSYLGVFLSSEYYFELQFLQGGFSNQSQFNVSVFQKILLESQEEDGSWKQIINENTNEGALDTTVVNYWFLKATGINPDDDLMQRAANFVKSKGGIESCQVMTKFKLASFGQYDWSNLYYIPMFLFKNKGLYSKIYMKDIVAQWIWPHMTPLAYLRYHRTIFNLGPQADLKDLYVEPPQRLPYEDVDDSKKEKENLNEDVANIINEMLELQQPKGSFGTYTVSTLLSLMALKDFQDRYIQAKNYQLDDNFQKGFDFVESSYFNKDSPYQGCFGDGRWWDTILVSWALIESGENPQTLETTAQYMIDEALQPYGGLPFGYDFEYAPDIDDTSLFVVFLKKLGNNFKWPMSLSVQWLFSMQNSDGGFAAFNKDLTGTNLLFKYLFDFAGISDSAEIFDPSCADITGHNLEAFGEVGYQYPDPRIKNAIQFLINTQKDFGSWEARWGINYIYSVGCVLPGLRAVGYNLSELWVQRSVKWLLSRQNTDGGFGENILSYNDPEEYNGRGNSTATQTAWALLGLLEVYKVYDDSFNVKEAVHRGVQYLLDLFESQNRWVDSSVVGTGHRGILYLQYPSYPESFPLIAVSRFKKLLEQK